MFVRKIFFVAFCVFASLILAANVVSTAEAQSKAKPVKTETVNAFFDVNKMSDMSDYDPANPIIPTGDTIKIAVVMPFSGPAALNGQMSFAWVQWVAQ